MASSRMLQYLLVLAFLVMVASAGNFNQDVVCTYGGPRCQSRGNLLTLSLDKVSGSGFNLKNQYKFGRFDVQMKLVPSNPAGTVTTFYLTSFGPFHNEIDIEFLGNQTGQPYTLHTNVYCQGQGNREQQFRLWFDPTKTFYTYSIVWNPQRIIILVNDSPIRVFENNEAKGIPYPNDQPMSVFASLWDGEDWATQGGRVKTDWTKAPFIASYRNFNTNNACVWNSSTNSSSCNGNSTVNSQGLDAKGRKRLRFLQSKFMIYNYCTDSARFPNGFPPECKL